MRHDCANSKGSGESSERSLVVFSITIKTSPIEFNLSERISAKSQMKTDKGMPCRSQSEAPRGRYSKTCLKRPL